MGFKVFKPLLTYLDTEKKLYVQNTQFLKQIARTWCSYTNFRTVLSIFLINPKYIRVFFVPKAEFELLITKIEIFHAIP